MRSLKIRKPFQLIQAITFSTNTICIRHRCQYPHGMYSNYPFFIVWKHIAKFRFKKNGVNTSCVPSSEQSKKVVVESGMNKVQILVGLEHDVSQKFCIVDDYMQDEHTEACVYD